MADAPNKSAIPETGDNIPTNTTNDILMKSANMTESNVSTKTEEKNQNSKSAPTMSPPPAIPLPSKNPIHLLDSSATVFNEEYNKSMTVLKSGKGSTQEEIWEGLFKKGHRKTFSRDEDIVQMDKDDNEDNAEDKRKPATKKCRHYFYILYNNSTVFMIMMCLLLFFATITPMVGSTFFYNLKCVFHVVNNGGGDK